MIYDYEELTPIYREKYRLTVLPRWRKRLILLKMIFLEILFLFQVSYIAIKSIIFLLTVKKGHYIKNISYGPKDRNKCDIYVPPTSNYIENNKKDCPVVVFVHGGSWGYGNKTQYILLGKKLSERGIVVMNINYTLVPNGNIDDMLEDVDNALLYCYDHIGDYGGDRNKIYLMGHSAGGHIITQFVVDNYLKPIDQQDEKEKEKRKIPLAGVLPLSAPLHINDHFLFETKRGLEHISPMRPAMKGPKHFDRYSPSWVLNKVKDKSIRDDKLSVPFPPFYILHGQDDATVPLSSSTKFFSILMAKLSNPTARSLFIKSYSKIKHIDFIFNMYDDNRVINRNIFEGIVDDDDDDDDYNDDIKNNNKKSANKSSIFNDIVNIINN